MKKKLIFGNRQDIALCGPVTHNRRGHLVLGAYTGMLEPDGRRQVVYFATGTADLAKALAEAEKFLQKLKDQWDREKARASCSNQNAPPDPGPEIHLPVNIHDINKPSPPKIRTDHHFSYTLSPELKLWLEEHKRHSPDAWIFPKLHFCRWDEAYESTTLNLLMKSNSAIPLIDLYRIKGSQYLFAYAYIGRVNAQGGIKTVAAMSFGVGDWGRELGG